MKDLRLKLDLALLSEHTIELIIADTLTVLEFATDDTAEHLIVRADARALIAAARRRLTPVPDPYQTLEF